MSYMDHPPTFPGRVLSEKFEANTAKIGAHKLGILWQKPSFANWYTESGNNFRVGNFWESWWQNVLWGDFSVVCVAGGLVRKRKVRWSEFDFWRHVVRKFGEKGVGEGTRKTACPKTSIFYFRLFCINRTIWPIGRRPSLLYQIAIEAWH